MANQYTKLTPENVKIKVSRKRNPVTNWVQLANEFGVNTKYTRANGKTGSAAPASFRRKVRAMAGNDVLAR